MYRMSLQDIFVAHWGFVAYNLQIHISLTIGASNKKNILGVRKNIKNHKKSSLFFLNVNHKGLSANLPKPT